MRPFLRLALSTPRPVGVAIRARKPDVRVARRLVPRLVQPRQVLAFASTVSGEREEMEGLEGVAGLRAGARETPVGCLIWCWVLIWRRRREEEERGRKRKKEGEMRERRWW